MYGYIFNPWATGEFVFKSAASSHTSYKAMKALANQDTEIKKRFDTWLYRSVEELYDYDKDPDALHNLIEDPAYKEVVNELRRAMLEQMKKTADYTLSAFKNKDDKAYLNKWMKKEMQEANQRAESIQWKRSKNSNGPTENNNQLYKTK